MGFLGLGGDKTSTSTQTIGADDAAYVDQIRAAGQRTDAATQGGNWAEGVNPLTQQAAGQYGDIYGGLQGLYGQYGQMADQYGQYTGALDFANQTGLQGMGEYMNPMLDQYYAGMNPMYDQQRAQAGMAVDQGSTLAGGYGGSRSAVANMYGQNQINLAQGADYGRIQYGAGRDAAGMLLSERGRMQNLGFGAMQGQASMYGAQQGVLNQQQGVSGAQAQLGDYMRDVRMQQNQDQYRRSLAGGQAMQDSYMGPKKQVRTDVEEGSVFGDLMGIAGTVGSFMVPGAGAALSGLSGFGQNMGSNTPGGMQGPSSNIWDYERRL